MARIIKGLDPTLFSRVFQDEARKGKDILSIAIDLMPVLGSETVSEAFQRYLEGDPASRFKSTLDCLRAARQEGAPLLEAFLNKAFLLKIDISPALAELKPLLAGHETALLHRLRAWSDAGLDLTPIQGTLESLFVEERGEAVLASSCLTFWALSHLNWSGIDRLLSHCSEHVRWGAVRALYDRLGCKLPADYARNIVDRLCQALGDDDKEVRKQAIEALEKARCVQNRVENVLI